MRDFGKSRKRDTNKFKLAKRIGLPLAMTVFLAGCAEEGADVYSFSANVPVAQRWAAAPHLDPGTVSHNWLARFGSSKLDSLVKEALSNNPDLRAAAYRVAEARALARKANAGFYPDVDLEVDARRIGPLERKGATPRITENQFDTNFEIAWEADVWGRIRSGQVAALRDAQAQELIYAYARQSLAALVADAWIVANGNARKLQISRNQLASRRQSQADIAARVEARTLIAVDEVLARSDLASAQAEVAEREGALAESLRVLEVLLGRYPSAETKNLRGLPRLPGMPKAGLPSQLLERRPDIVARERQVAAAFYRKREAQAARLPSLTLSADLFGRDSNLGGSLDPANIVWSLTAGIIAPLLDGGERKEEVNVRTARQATALAEYGAAALRAFAEVESALKDDQVLARREGFLSRASNNLRQALNIEQERYDAAEIDRTRLEDTRIRYFAVQQQLVDIRVERLRNRIQLHLALGGSFDMPKPPVVETEAEAEE